MNPQRDIQDEQVRAMAYSFGIINGLYRPLDIIGCMGGQTYDKDILFYGYGGAIQKFRDRASRFQLKSLPIPEIVTTTRKEIGFTGAAAYWLSKKQRR